MDPLTIILATDLGYLAIVSLILISLYYVFLVWNAKVNSRPIMFFPRVSAMAYAWQSGNIIERKIKNFLSQDYPTEKLEIIIYDNNSTDETPAICRRYEEKRLIK